MINTSVDILLERQDESSLSEASELSSDIEDQIQSSFEVKLAFAKSLSSFVRVNHNLDEQQFSNFSRHLFHSLPRQLIAIQLVKDSVITYNYPEKGNEKVLGVDIKAISVDSEYVNNSFKNKAPMCIGPRILIQGILGMVYREPILLKDGTLWGYAVVVIDLENALLEINDIHKEVDRIALYSKREGLTQNGFFFGNDNIDSLEHVSNLFSVFNDEWVLKVQVEKEKTPAFLQVGFKILYLIIALTIGVLTTLVYTSLVETIRQKAQLQIQNEEIQGQLKFKTLLIDELHHRIKNHFQLISSFNKILYLKEADPKQTQIISEINNRVTSMAQLYDQLKDSEAKEIQLDNYIVSLCANFHGNFSQQVDFVYDLEECRIDVKRCTVIGVLINELITNSFKHSFKKKKGRIKLILLKDTIKQKINLQYLDDGQRLDKEILTHKHHSQGIELIKLIAEQIEAELTYYKDDVWNGFVLTFPI